MSPTSGLMVFVGVTLLQLFGCAICSPLDASSVHVTIETIPNLEAFRKANPNLEIAPLTARSEQVKDSGSTRQVITYTVGSHSAGERLVGMASNQQSWATLQDVTLDLQYPTNGVGAIVTYVEVVVSQSSSTGRGYIVSGGVGQRNIRLVIEAYNTLFFNYNAAIYGW
ncbi:uncharacterized protein LOC126561081 [Anopheles maculipalpis]|uniref:uncharacterized protein LOC126561081 n=1 Tax=Anopheles maculipalpis TaxID=1496333 RepID=UPI002158B185|nr:uncharacterized protein LOC126561081 [Anopheles maculipalpis]